MKTIDHLPFAKKIKCIKSECKGTMIEQLQNCLSSINEDLSGNEINNSILRLCVFLNVNNNAAYYKLKSELSKVMLNYFDNVPPPVSFIAQSPGNCDLAIEVMYVTGRDKYVEVSMINYAGVGYCKLLSENYEEIIISGLCQDDAMNTEESASHAFSLLANILKKEDMDFSDIVRQWNYIENITDTFTTSNRLLQNYQVFNDVRSLFYDQSEFVNGFPAATGIGQNAGGVIIDVIAIRKCPDTTILPINNPQQTNAFTYSKKVLEGSAIDEIKNKTTPKFERAKAIVYQRNAGVFVSGTASIIGQTTSDAGNTEKQIKTTISNIDILTSENNLSNAGLRLSGFNKKYLYVRVYVKNKEDIDLAKAYVEKHYPDIPWLILQADICREELRVEIEGALIIS